MGRFVPAAPPSPAALALGREVEARATFEWLGAALHVDDGLVLAPSWPGDGDVDDARATLLHEGYVVLPDVVGAPVREALAAAAASLVATGKPATFVYAYDEAWTLLDGLGTTVASILDRPVDVLADVWAFHVPPRDDAGGWPPHRGTHVDVRGADGRPTMLTAWVALTDAPADGACMHFLPRHRDRAFFSAHPEDLSFPPEHGRAVPIRAGDALLFDANVIHWGGASSRSRPGPRVSITYSFGRRGVDHGPVIGGALPFERRKDVIAHALRMYAYREPGPTALAAPWAMTRARK